MFRKLTILIFLFMICVLSQPADQKFGFNVNDGNGLPALYFNSYQVTTDGFGGVNTVTAIVYDQTNTHVFRQTITGVNWVQFQDFTVSWIDDSINFSIDYELYILRAFQTPLKKEY